MFIQPTRTNRKEGTPDENAHAKNHSVAPARCAAFQRVVVHEERLLGKTEQHRLLDLHDAPFRAREGSRQMSHLLDGSRAGD
jgi:hypothetical protein